MRPVEERELIRRKSFAFASMSVEQAVGALKDLDHDFFLFHDADADADAMVYRGDDGALGLIKPPSAKPTEDRGAIHEKSRFSAPIDLATAIAEMNAFEHRFLFFENAETIRGNVIYRRDDGHYGVIEPA